MKLKRFLLRYSPPGLGMEFETSTGALEIKHIDVDTQALQSATPADIEKVARSIIEGEQALGNKILTERKHLEAISQLLRRLFDIQEEAPHEPASPGAKVFNVGDPVVLVGLRDTEKEKYAQQRHNGELGDIVEAKPHKDKYEVRISGKHEEQLSAKGKNIVPQVKGQSLTIDAHVVIRGLRNHTELNGCFGRITECHESHRYEVRANESQQLFRVKEDNLVLIDPNCQQVRESLAKQGQSGGDSKRGLPSATKENRDPHAAHNKGKGDAPVAAANGEDAAGVMKPGTMVRLTGLKTAMAYNGQTAEVLAVDVARSRYEIRLADGSVKTVRAENVEKC